MTYPKTYLKTRSIAASFIALAILFTASSLITADAASNSSSHPWLIQPSVVNELIQIAMDDGAPPEDVDMCEGEECEGHGGSEGPPDIED